jgi:hypothetical protein
MHGRTFPRFSLSALALLAVLAAGCAQDAPPSPVEPASLPDGTAFNPSATGVITGHVRWTGPLPYVLPIQVRSSILPVDLLKQQRDRPNPNAPVINPKTRGVAGAVVFLRGVDARAAGPWHHGPARVQLRDLSLHVLQDAVDSHVGFVRLGDRIEAVSRDLVFHSLHLGGAAFFTIPFPGPNEPATRPLDRPGLIELTSAAGYPWMRAYLFVAEHPYYARTDAAGRFVLEHVPAGRYEAACWLPNWVEERHDREPETGIVSRVFFRLPVEQGKGVIVGKQQAPAVDFTLSEQAFHMAPPDGR